MNGSTDILMSAKSKLEACHGRVPKFMATTVTVSDAGFSNLNLSYEVPSFSAFGSSPSSRLHLHVWSKM